MRMLNLILVHQLGRTEMKVKFCVDHPEELGAGIRGFNDVVTISVASGNPGGEQGEFEEFMKDCLAEWYDGASVTIEE